MSPTARTLAQLRAEGWTCQIVEKWNPFSKTRQDLFGCIDIVAIHVAHAGVLGVQCTSATNVAARVAKARQEPRIDTWINAANTFEVWGWGKTGKRGTRKTWTVRKVTL